MQSVHDVVIVNIVELIVEVLLSFVLFGGMVSLEDFGAGVGLGDTGWVEPGYGADGTCGGGTLIGGLIGTGGAPPGGKPKMNVTPFASVLVEELVNSVLVGGGGAGGEDNDDAGRIFHTLTTPTLELTAPVSAFKKHFFEAGS